MNKLIVKMIIVVFVAVYISGCGKKEETSVSLENLKKKSETVATEAKASGEKAASDASKITDKTAADAKKAVNNATK